jgi:hypothetical protein
MRRAGRHARWTPIGGAFALVLATAPAIAQAPSGCGESVTVEPGDTLHRITVRCSISVAALMGANPQIADPDLIQPASA